MFTMSNQAKNPKYQAIYQKGKELFWKHGIKRVTIEEVCREAKVSKVTFYKFFPNKLELAKSILDEIFISSVEKFEDIIEGDMDFSKKIEALFLLKIQAGNHISQEFINDMYKNPDLGLKAYMDEKAESMLETVNNFYRDSQAKGFIRKEVNIDFISAFPSHLSGMMEDEVLMAQYAEPMDFVIEIMNLLFYGIVTR
jgi:AcrR family transcriptional regulator